MNCCLKGNSDGWTSSKAEIAGVHWARSKRTVTFGIGMWKEAFLLKRGDGTQVKLTRSFLTEAF